MKLSKTFLGGLGQWIAGGLCLAGILIEVSYRAHAGFILITLGSVMFAIFTKVKYLNGKR